MCYVIYITIWQMYPKSHHKVKCDEQCSTVVLNQTKLFTHLEQKSSFCFPVTIKFGQQNFTKHATITSSQHEYINWSDKTLPCQQ